MNFSLQNALLKIILPQQKASAVSAPWLTAFGAGQNSGIVVFYWHKGRRGKEKATKVSSSQALELGCVTSLKMCLVNLQSVELWQVLESRLSNELDGIVIKVAAK